MAIALAIAWYFFYRRARRWTPPHFSFSSLTLLSSPQRTLKEQLAYLPQQTLACAVGCFLLALIDFHVLEPESTTSAAPKEGLALYLVLDVSGSMARPTLTYTASGERRPLTKLDLMKEVTTSFVSERPNDLIGLTSFARTPHVQVPLTLDHSAITEALQHLNLADPSQEGTALGYAIYKTAHLITLTQQFAKELKAKGENPYTIAGGVIIAITDGFQEPNPLDRNDPLRAMPLTEAASFAEKNHIRLYIVNINPIAASKEFTLSRRLLSRLAEETGGKFFLVDATSDLQAIYSTIDTLEKAPLPTQERFIKRRSLFPWLLQLGILLAFTAFLFETTLFRRAP